MQRIQNAVIGEAKAQAQVLLKDARARAEEQLQTAQAELKAEHKRATQQARSRCEQEYAQRLGRLRASLRITLSKVKSDLVAEAFQKAQEHLANLAQEDYQKLLERWLAEVGEGGGELILNERDAKLLSDGLLAKINASKPDKDKFTRSSEPQDMMGGFLLRREGFEIDMRLESRLQSLKDELLPEVAAMLFNKGLQE